MMHLIIISLVAVVITQAANLPVDFKVCKRSDPNILQCLSENVQDAVKKLENGNKALGMNSLNPLKIKEMRGMAAGSVHVEEIYTDLELGGLGNSKVEVTGFDIDNCKIEFVSYSPSIAIKSNYEMKGQFSVFTINGKGKSNISLDKLKIRHNLDCEHYNKDGIDYIRVTSYKVKFEEYELHLDYTNLVPGNPTLSNEINSVLKENSNALFGETKASHEKGYGEIFKQLANKVFDKIPTDDIFPK